MKDKLIQIKLIVLYVFKKVSKIKINLASAVHLAYLGPNLFVFLILFFKYIQLFISSGLICLCFIRFTNFYNISSTLEAKAKPKASGCKAVGSFFFFLLHQKYFYTNLAIFQLQLSLSFK